MESQDVAEVCCVCPLTHKYRFTPQQPDLEGPDLGPLTNDCTISYWDMLLNTSVLLGRWRLHTVTAEHMLHLVMAVVVTIQT